jgi:hypothetical protein
VNTWAQGDRIYFKRKHCGHDKTISLSIRDAYDIATGQAVFPFMHRTDDVVVPSPKEPASVGDGEVEVRREDSGQLDLDVQSVSGWESPGGDENAAALSRPF